MQALIALKPKYVCRGGRWVWVKGYELRVWSESEAELESLLDMAGLDGCAKAPPAGEGVDE